MNWDSLDWKWQFGIELGWHAALGFVRASVLFTVFTVCAVLGVGLVLLIFWLSGGYAALLASELQSADTGSSVAVFWVLSLLGAIGISLPFAAFNGISQGIWAALTADQLDDHNIQTVLTWRAILLNVLGLPLLILFILLLISGNPGEAVSGALVALTATVPIGIVAYTSIAEVVDWYNESPYCVKRKRKSKRE
jgi:hypothetical protein